MDGQRRGRPALGVNLVESIDGASPVARDRLEAILRTLNGEWTLEEASAKLGVGRSWFCELRRRFLAESATLLEPRRRGPSPHVETEAERRAAQLQQHIEDLEMDVQAAQIREELAAAMPARTPSRPKKKKKRRRRSR